jgi:hypothetical protein
MTDWKNIVWSWVLPIFFILVGAFFFSLGFPQLVKMSPTDPFSVYPLFVLAVFGSVMVFLGGLLQLSPVRSFVFRKIPFFSKRKVLYKRIIIALIVLGLLFIMFPGKTQSVPAFDIPPNAE